MPERINTSNDVTEQRRIDGKAFPQIVASLLSTLAIFSAGTYLAWSSPALPLFNGPGELQMSDEQGSWVGSMIPLGALLGAIPAGVLADKVGRKVAILMVTLPLFVCWVVIGYPPNVVSLCLGRLVAGIACGAATVVVPVYISEIAETRIRGSLGSLFQLQITIGILFGYTTGYTKSLAMIAILCSLIPALLLVTFPFMPESPVWLVAQSRIDEAKSAIRRLRGPLYDVQYELSVLELSQQQLQGEKVSVTELFSHHRKGLSIALGLMIFQQLSGVNTVIFYAETIFIAAGSKMSSTTSSVIVGIVQVFATYGSTMLVDRTGRRILLMISSSVMAVCLFSLGAYFHFKINDDDLSSFAWLPLFSMVIFIVVFSVGYGPIPWIIIGEVFPSNVKGIASSTTALCNWTLAFLVTKIFHSMVSMVGLASSYVLFALICVGGSFFVHFLVPETKGKTIDQVQGELYGARTFPEARQLTQL